ncbi:MAG TPA: metallophosphoesterase [Thermoanaerobaculia bacterium]|nr:metallophosphoesterase [Thermoanaerobaculia bacterium]
MSDLRHRLRLLHVSDLHERGSREQEPWRRRRVLGEAWDRNLAELLQDGPIDLVCFTGDAADWGLREEYEKAGEFLHALLERLHLTPDRLFVIPGNHDIERPVHEATWKRLREVGPQVDELGLARWLAGGPPPLGVEAGWRDEILARQSGYRHWVREVLGRPELDPERSPHGRLGYRATLEMPGWGFPIHLIGFDTAWLCGDDHDAGKLRLTDSQVLSLTNDAQGDPLPGLRLVLMHHPFGELADGAACRRLLHGRADLVLRGHLHETEVETWVDPDRKVRQLAAGCLYEGHRADCYPNACQVCTLTLDAQGHVLQADLRFRSFAKRGHWFDDDSLYNDSRGGRLTWFFTETPKQAAISNPYDPWTPVMAPHFVGRRQLLRRLEAALAEGRSVSLVGDWRIGKSSVLQTWFEKQRDKGREVQLLSGGGSEGASPQALVEKITGRPCSEEVDLAAEALERWVQTKGLPGLPPLLLIDELDSMVPCFEHRFFERLRGMLGRIVLVLASCQELDLLYRETDRASPFFNRLELQRVGLLEPAEARLLIARGGGLLAPQDRELLFRWAGRHPFYLQLLGRHLGDARRNGQATEQALDLFRTEAASSLRELWRVLDPRDRESLRATISGRACLRLSLRMRGLVTDEGWLFGEVLADWLREET